MSAHGFHVHGPHDHEVEHVAQHGGDNFTSRVAVLTAVLSTVGAIFGYLGGHSQNAALLYKNEAAIQKTRLESVELLSGQEQQAEPCRAVDRP
jgi:hypothetical protein